MTQETINAIKHHEHKMQEATTAIKYHESIVKVDFATNLYETTAIDIPQIVFIAPIMLMIAVCVIYDCLWLYPVVCIVCAIIACYLTNLMAARQAINTLKKYDKEAACELKKHYCLVNFSSDRTKDSDSCFFFRNRYRRTYNNFWFERLNHGRLQSPMSILFARLRSCKWTLLCYIGIVALLTFMFSHNRQADNPTPQKL